MMIDIEAAPRALVMDVLAEEKDTHGDRPSCR